MPTILKHPIESLLKYFFNSEQEQDSIVNSRFRVKKRFRLILTLNSATKTILTSPKPNSAMRKFLFLVLLYSAFGYNSNAQDHLVKGVVSGLDGNPIPSATVQSNIGNVTVQTD